MDDLGDNLYHGKYSIKYLIRLYQEGADREEHPWRSAYRSFEGEVFEIFAYERLVRYVKNHPAVEKFIAKIPGTKPGERSHAMLMLNRKGQIVYRVRNRDLGEFDTLIFTKDRLYFVEMTLTSSVTDLKKRLPKKRALLQLLFPKYDVHALLVVNEKAMGTTALPEYATAWKSKGIDTWDIFQWIAEGKKEPRKRFQRTEHDKLVSPSSMDVRTFQYYDTIIWLLHSLRGKGEVPLNLPFYRSEKFRRFHDLYTKVYIGTLEGSELAKLYPDAPKCDTFVYVAIEKEPLGGTFLTYFHYKGKKSLDNIRVVNGRVNVVKKDPNGITVTEMAHLTRRLKPLPHLTYRQIRDVEKLLKEENGDG